MKSRIRRIWIVMLTLFATVPTALASTTWYVNGVIGSDSNNCMSARTACKTIGHAISHASSGDSIVVAAATYAEHLTVPVSLRIIGAYARTTIIDGGGVNTLVTIPTAKLNVTLSNLSIRNGTLGISNNGTLLVSSTSINRNIGYGAGGGIINFGTMTIRNSTISGNYNRGVRLFAAGGGIANHGTLTLSNSTVFGNTVGSYRGFGGGIFNGGTLTISNTTISGNYATKAVGGVFNNFGSTTVLQNSIVANSRAGGDCIGTVTSDGYNLSSDNSCDLHGPGDHNNTDPLLGVLQNNNGPTDTMALQNGSPAIDSGNPSGCTDGQGHLLKTDQRGMQRPDTEDKIGCDMGAYERQGD